MRLRRGALLSGAFLLATASASFAQSWIPNRLYLRGDVGGAFENDVTFEDANTGGLCTLCGNTLPAETGRSVMFGGGIGYRFMPMFRSDFTLDYIPVVQGERLGCGRPRRHHLVGGS